MVTKAAAAMRKLLSLGLISAVLAFAATSHAQAPQGPPPSLLATAPLQVRQLTPTVYWVQGGVGNAGFVVGDKGVIVIDATISSVSAKELLADIAKVTPKPVTTVILTHGDIDHVGGLNGFPAGITVIAHAENAKRIQAAIVAGRSRIAADHAPNRTVGDHETTTIDGLKIELLHWAPAHTAGDLVIFLPTQKVVFTGDIFALDQPRALIHREQQGTSEGWLTTARGILALAADRFVVGHGDVQTKASLAARVKLVADERAQIAKLVAEGKTLAQIQADVGDPPPGSAAPAPGGPRFTAFSQVVFEELTEKK
jgi:cyclase